MKIDLSEIHTIRQEYIKAELHEENVNSDAIQQFTTWFEEALHSKIMEPSAMTLATTNDHGKPSARIVLLKNIDKKGFIFYTNYKSHKGKDIEQNKQVSLSFFWPELERQIRIEGLAEKVSFSESEHYFHSRPFGSQISAVASSQSEVIESRHLLAKRHEELQMKYQDKQVPMPKHWGGYRVVPQSIEFWQGRANRLHDRLVYFYTNDHWHLSRLAP